MNKGVGDPHPYGILPEGNRFFLLNEQKRDGVSSSSNCCLERNVLHMQSIGLGHYFNRLKDTLILEILGFCEGRDLGRLATSSIVFYVYTHHCELWRDLTLRLNNGFDIIYTNTWKDTYVNALRRKNIYQGNGVSNIYSHLPMKIRGIFSNDLYQSWSCYSCDLESACIGIYRNSDIDKIKASDLPVAKFISNYEEKNIPVVITDAVNHWPCLQKNSSREWSIDRLVQLCGDAKLRATSASAPLPANFTMKEYVQYAKQAKEEAPLYLFERNFAKISSELASDYDVPSYFNSGKVIGTDLFRLFGEQARPDHKWLIMGPARSGSIFHIDPNQTNAWNVCIKGRKKWIFYPPENSPPGVQSSDDGADVAVPISTGEWLLTFWKFHLQQREHANPQMRPLEVILNPGETIFVPHGYWHMVVNLDDCIALTHNYVSTSNLSDCLRFLREAPDQISGVRDRQIEGSIQPTEMYEKFTALLPTLLGKEKTDTYIQKSFEKLQQKRNNVLIFNQFVKKKRKIQKSNANDNSIFSPLTKKDNKEQFLFDFKF